MDLFINENGLDLTPFSIDWLPKELIARDDQLRKIAYCIQNDRNCGIVGGSGTGKSTCARYVMSRYETEVNTPNKLKLIFFDLSEAGTSNKKPTCKKILTSLHQDLYDNKKVGYRTDINVIIHEIKTYLTHHKIYLFLDEYERLPLDEFSNLVKVLTLMKVKGCFITNNINYNQQLLPEINHRLAWMLTLFPPYTKEDICKILEHRITESGVTTMVSKKEIQWLSNECAVDGDARLALEAMISAIHIARQNNKGLTLKSLEDSLEMIRARTLIDSIKSLDTESLLILYCVGDGSPSKLHNDLYPQYKVACKEFKLTAQHFVTIWRKTITLESYGYLVITQQKHLGRGKGPQKYISLSSIFSNMELKDIRLKIQLIIDARLDTEKH